MPTTRYHADCRDCPYVRVGLNQQPVYTGGRIHESRSDHTVEFRITGGDVVGAD